MYNYMQLCEMCIYLFRRLFLIFWCFFIRVAKVSFMTLLCFFCQTDHLGVIELPLS